MEGHDSLLLGWYPTPTTPAYPAVDLPPGSQASASSTSNLVRLAPGDYPDLRTPIIQQHEPGETNSTTVSTGPVAAAAAAANAATAAAAATSTANATTSNNGATAPGVQSGVSNSSIASVSTAGGSGVSTTAVHLSSPAVAASSVGPIGNTRGTGGHNNETVVVHLASRMGSTVQQNAAASAQHHTQQQQQQAHSLHLSSHHAIVAPSVAQLHVTQGGGGQLATNQNGPMGGTQLLQQVVAHPAGAGGHQLVHMVLHHHGASAQANNAATAATLQLGGLTSVGGGGVTVQALTGGVSMANLGAGIGGAGVVGVSSFGVLESEETMGIANAGGPPFRCDECGHIAKTRRMLKRHLATVHSQERNFACPYCDAKFKLSGHLNEHLAARHNIGKCTCDQCGKLFSTPFRLKQHTLLAHQDYRFPCVYEGCDYKSKYQQQLNKHVRLKHLGIDSSAASGRRKCTICDFEGYCLAAHVRAVHTKEKPYKCQHCERTFSDRNNQRAHEHRVHSKERLRHKCSFCEQMFYTPGRLREHIAVRHTHEHTHLCENCGFSTAVERTYLRHRKSNCNFHETPLKCSRCDFTTHIPFLYKTHKASCDADEAKEEVAADDTEKKQPEKIGGRHRKVKNRIERPDMPWEEDGVVSTEENGHKSLRVRTSQPAKKRGSKVVSKERKMHWTSSEGDDDNVQTTETGAKIDAARIMKKVLREPKPVKDLNEAQALPSEVKLEQETKPEQHRKQCKLSKVLSKNSTQSVRRESGGPADQCNNASVTTEQRCTRAGTSRARKTPFTTNSTHGPRIRRERVQHHLSKNKPTSSRNIGISLNDSHLSIQSSDANCTEVVSPASHGSEEVGGGEIEKESQSTPNREGNSGHTDIDNLAVDSVLVLGENLTSAVAHRTNESSVEPSYEAVLLQGKAVAADGALNQDDEVTIERSVDDAQGLDEEVEMFACPQCDTFFVDQAKFAAHIVEAHVNKVKIRVGSKEWRKVQQ